MSDTLASPPLGELGIQGCYGPLGSGGQQMPVYLVSHVDVPMAEEVGKFGDLDASREHRRRVGVAQRVRREPVRDVGCLGSVDESEVDSAVLLKQPPVSRDERATDRLSTVSVSWKSWASLRPEP